MTAILKVDEIQDTSGNNIINENAGTITIGKSGDTVNLASGATNNLGITEIDNWRITADTTVNGFITSNWERNDSADFEKLGTGMTESSGVFSFPSTGKYLIIAHGEHALNNKTSASFNIYSTVDNSTYTFRTSGATETSHSSSFTSSNAEYVMNVTNLTNDKVKFQTSGYSSGATLRGNTDQNETNVLFIKLA